METFIKKTSIQKQNATLPVHIIQYRLSGTFRTLFRKIRVLLTAFRDFIECPAFYEGERTDTSAFEVKILQINKINNK